MPGIMRDQSLKSLRPTVHSTVHIKLCNVCGPVHSTVHCIHYTVLNWTKHVVNCTVHSTVHFTLYTVHLRVQCRVKYLKATDQGSRKYGKDKTHWKIEVRTDRTKNPAYGRHWILRPMRMVAPIKVCVSNNWSSFLPKTVN